MPPPTVTNGAVSLAKLLSHFLPARLLTMKSRSRQVCLTTFYRQRCSNSLICLSYQKSLPQLRAWAAASALHKGIDWYLKPTGRKHKHIGRIHETYVCLPGKWETIYYNLRPTGVGQAKIAIQKDSDGKESLVSPLINAAGKQGQSGYSPMSRDDTVSAKL